MDDSGDLRFEGEKNVFHVVYPNRSNNQNSKSFQNKNDPQKMYVSKVLQQI